MITVEHDQSWNDIAYKHGWFWHTTYWREYLLNSQFEVAFADHSFRIGNDGIANLIQQDDELYCPGFIGDPDDFRVTVLRIAEANNIKRISVKGLVPGYEDISTHTCIIDPANIQPTKGHKSDIKKAEKYLTCVKSYDILGFLGDYFRIAGKITRPYVTFAFLLQWICMGFGTLLVAKLDGITIGYTYILHWGDYAYYFMSCVEPEYREYNVGHFLQARVFDLLTAKGINKYELGEQAGESATEKELNISKFKRGFGGQIVASPASEHYFLKERANESSNNISFS